VPSRLLGWFTFGAQYEFIRREAFEGIGGAPRPTTMTRPLMMTTKVARVVQFHPRCLLCVGVTLRAVRLAALAAYELSIKCIAADHAFGGLEN